MLEKLKKATPGELQVWMLSATATGIGFGALIASSIAVYALWIFIVALTIHLIMMWVIYLKK